MGFYADAATALADSCLHYWRMDASEGANTITDSIGNYDGAIVPTFDVNGANPIEATPFGEGRRTFFYTGMGVSDCATLYCDPSSAGLSSTQYWNASFRIRIKYDAITAFGDMAASIGNRNSDLGSLALYIRDSSGSAPTCKWSRPTNAITGNIPNANRSDWLEIVATSEGDSSGCTLRLYLNGSQIGSSVTGANKGGLNPYSQAIAFGGEYPATVYCPDGIVDEAAFWSRTLSAGEISSLYNGGASQYILNTSVQVSQGAAISWQTLQTVDYYLVTRWNVESSAYVYPPDEDLNALIDNVTYLAFLTGANDALPDIGLPISSFNARLRSGRESYASIVCPHGASNIEAIEARPNGELVIQQIIGSQVTELARVNFQDLRIDKGAKVGSTLTLSGYKQTTYETPASWSSDKYSYYSKGSGKSRVRMQANAAVRPEDQMTVEGATFVIDTVTLIGSVNRVYMELSE